MKNVFFCSSSVVSQVISSQIKCSICESSDLISDAIPRTQRHQSGFNIITPDNLKTNNK